MGMSGVELGSTTNRPALRHRITFGTARTLAYVSVLELGTVWERTLRRARVPLKYSQGFNPRPRMHFAAPLPVGCGSEADLLDITIEEPWSSEALAAALQTTTPADLTVVSIAPVDDTAPALSELLIEAEYRVWLRDVSEESLRAAVETLRNSESIPVVKQRRGHPGKTYDLRPLIKDLQVIPDTPAPWVGLWLWLEARTGATGRPDEVLKAMDLMDHPQRCSRTRLILEGAPATP
jgi:radical SAM-linked protein